MADRRRNDAELDAWALIAEREEDRREPVVRRVALGGEPQQLASANRTAADLRACALDLAQYGAGGSKEALASFGGNETARVTSEQRHADAPFQGAESVAQRRL